MKFTGKVWKGGTGTLVISIRKKIKEHYGIKEGDLLELDLKKLYRVKKKDEKQTTIK